MSPLSADWLCPDWPAPARVRSCVTTRQPGVSLPPYDAFNLALHVGDDPRRVAHNRALLCQRLACQPGWLEQVHGTQVVAV
ncbi:laccase domain-containing protein, partial [Pseudomonas fluvialis]|uniref:laccase domain-containing protein n=1 Tax=Pseudomonas fluvialis TaxID=1793966 RepID=UPI0035AF48DA